LFVIKAKSHEAALCNLLNYLTQLKRRYTRPTSGNLWNPAQLGREFIFQINNVSDPAAMVLVIHSFVEFWLSQIVWKFCPNRDLSKWDFYKKLELSFAMQKIPKNLWINLSKLNDLRRQAAHQSHMDFTTIDLNYRDCIPEFELSAYRPSYAPDAAHHHVFNVLIGIASVTYWPLHTHCMKELLIGRTAEGVMADFLVRNNAVAE